MTENVQIKNGLFRQEVFSNCNVDEEAKSVRNMQKTIKILSWAALAIFISASFCIGMYLHYFPAVLSYVL